MLRRHHILAAILAAVLLAAVGVRWGCAPSGPELPAPAEPTADAGSADAAAATEEPVTEAWLAPELAEGAFAARRNGEPLSCDFVVGAAGVYPPLRRLATTGITLPEPAPTLAGEGIDSVEVLAQCGDHAFWSDVERAAAGVDVGPAQPLVVRVVDDSGRPVEGAAVFLGRAALGLVRLEEATDAAGEATFATIPAGEFVATVHARGRARAVTTVVPGRDNIVAVTDGFEVVGRVVGEGGQPLANATVAIHAGQGADPWDDVPADVVSTDQRGEFRAGPVSGGRVAAVATAPGWSTGRATADVPVDGAPVRLEISLARGRGVRVLVTDEGGAPVARAHVEWRDATARTGASSLSDGSGAARFDGVPPTAAISASLGAFVAGPVDLAALTGSPTGSPTEVRLTLKNSDSRIWRVRLNRPPAVELRSLEAHDGGGARCTVETVDLRDLTLRGCGEGALLLTGHTDRGLVQWSAGAFTDGVEVAMPAPTPLKVRVGGVPEEPWDHTTFLMFGADAVTLPLTATPSDGGRLLETAAYPGRVQLVVSNPRIGTQPFEFTVTDAPFEHGIELLALHLFRVFVVDGYGAPVTGAYAMLFADDKLVDVKRSAGQLPLEFRVRPPFSGELLVVDPRRGEGRVRLDTAGSDEAARVALREPVQSFSIPRSRLTRDELQRAVAGTLVARDAGWVFDVPAGGVATEAGLQRGDLLVTAWRVSGGVRVIVYRRGAGYTDVTLR